MFIFFAHIDTHTWTALSRLTGCNIIDGRVLGTEPDSGNIDFDAPVALPDGNILTGMHNFCLIQLTARRSSVTNKRVC